jgi:mannose-6-phosphate isomerase-like protein (cupin superfamily)
MKSERLGPKRGTKLRKNNDQYLHIIIDNSKLDKIFLINELNFLTNNIKKKDLKVHPNDHYMIINNGSEDLNLRFSQDITKHRVIYDPYKYENVKKEKIDPDSFQQKYEVPEGFIDILPKWYSIKFTYPKYNLIYIKPQMGISIQIHEERIEKWKILGGKPIILSGNKLSYYVEENIKFLNKIGDYHSIINPNSGEGQFVIIKERWEGHFDEDDITRIFNPNHYH